MLIVKEELDNESNNWVLPLLVIRDKQGFSNECKKIQKSIKNNKFLLDKKILKV